MCMCGRRGWVYALVPGIELRSSCLVGSLRLLSHLAGLFCFCFWDRVWYNLGWLRTHYPAEGDLELLALLQQLPFKCWSHWLALPCLSERLVWSWGSQYIRINKLCHQHVLQMFQLSDRFWGFDPFLSTSTTLIIPSKVNLPYKEEISSFISY